MILTSDIDNVFFVCVSDSFIELIPIRLHLIMLKTRK